MICAHMDEVGFIVKYINSDGTLSFGEVGGIDPSVVIGRQVKSVKISTALQVQPLFTILSKENSVKKLR